MIFIGGGGSSGGFFDYSQSEGGYIYGQYIVSSLTQNGYTAASLDFNDPIMGWLSGPGGMRRLACRPATVIHWVYDHIHQGGTSAPLCTATESGGSTAVADGLSHYGLGSILSMAEAAGGPPLTHLDHGCACDQGPSVGPCSPQPISPCYDPTDVFPIVDAAYFPQTLCADAYSGDISVLPQLQFDSVLSGADTLFSFPTTDVHVLIGGRDLSTAATEGRDWEQSITSKHSLACVATSGHSMPSFIDAANQIISDVINYCKVQ